MISVRRALIISLVERYALIVISLTSNILIARLLSPQDIGLYSVSLAVIGIAQVLRDFGVGSYLIQEKNLTEAHVRSAFGVSLLMGGALFVVAFLGASQAGGFYGDPRMVSTLRICALNFLALPFCTVSLALLRRDMLFQKVLYVTLTATTIGFLVTIGLAYNGFGANSMAIGTVVTNVATGLSAWIARGAGTIMLPGLSAWRSVTSFGAQRSAASVATTVTNDLSELVSGKILGFTSVAMLSRAQGLMNLFQRDLMSAVHGVALPAFAKSSRENRDLESLHLAAVAAITVAGWPFFGFVAMYALELLRFLFGSQWDQAAGFVPWYCLGGAVTAPAYLVGALLTAMSRIDVVTKTELVVQPLKAVIFVVGLLLFPSIDVPPILFVIMAVVTTPYFFYMKSKALPNDNAHLVRVLSKSGAVTAISMTGPIALALGFGKQGTPIAPHLVALAAVSCALGWFVGVYAVRHPIVKDPAFVTATRRIAMLFRKARH